MSTLAPPAREETHPALTAGQLERLRALAPPVDVRAGDVIYAAGARDYDFVVLDTGEVEAIRVATPDSPETVVERFGAPQFLGELGALTDQAASLTVRMTVDGRVRQVPRARFRRLMAEDPELSDIVLRAYMARRQLIKSGEGARSLEILGSRMSASALGLRNWAARQLLAHLWVDVDTPEGEALLAAADATADDLPVVMTQGAVLRHATPGVVAELLGLAYRPCPGHVLDLLVVGGGPAGLAAAMYGASEGLKTVLVDGVAVGGQAAASSRIENYLGFPSGLTGADLTGRALVQSQKFGARINSPCEARSLHAGDGQLVVTLDDGTEIATHAVIAATGARYRTLGLARWADFEGAGIYYAATELEVRVCEGQPVAVVGGANSAGQAALFLARRVERVRLVVRAEDLGAGMSRYLVDRILADPRIEVHTGTEVVELDGGAGMETITLGERSGGTRTVVPCTGLFCFIGAEPATAWLDGVARDDHGFVLTDHDLEEQHLDAAFALLGRRPLPYETSIPGVFAAGDARHGSMKRVAAAVGEGASAVHSVHRAIGV